LEQELFPFRKSIDGSLSTADFKKITSYYALGVPAILGEAFAALRGKELEKNERFSLSFLGGISGLLDDLFDDPAKEAQHLEEFIERPESCSPGNSFEALLLHMYLLGLSKSKHPVQLKKQAVKVFEAQQKSIGQQENFSSDFLQNVTFLKGGSSFVFYRLCLNELPEEAEKNLIFQLGGLMQLSNDIFDVWEDHQAGTKTLATSFSEIVELREQFIEELEKTYRLARETGFPDANIRKFLNLVLLGLSRVFVCLDQFEKLQVFTGGKFEISKYHRKQLICDMQKIQNRFKAVGYYITYSGNKRNEG
jgi:hypothetical protein